MDTNTELLFFLFVEQEQNENKRAGYIQQGVKEEGKLQREQKKGDKQKRNDNEACRKE